MIKRKEPIEIIRYTPSIDVGLTKDIVEKRYKDKIVNNTKTKSSKSYASIFFHNIFTFFNLIWALIFVALLVVHAYSDLLFIIVVVFNTVISIIQEIRAKITVERLSLLSLPRITVIRDSEQKEIEASKLVLDDIIKLKNGNQIPADCVIIEGQVEANESMLTGESKPIKKTSEDVLLAGSFLVSGECYARVNKVGKDSYIQTIAQTAKKFKSPQSNLFKDLNNLIRSIGIILVPVGVLMFLKEYGISNDISKTFIATSGSLIGMIPAGMYLLISIALAVGVIKLSRKRTLVKDLYSIEMLARSNVLCLDKTGTITDGTMTVVNTINYIEEDKINTYMSNILRVQKGTNATSVALVKKYGTSNDFIEEEITSFSSERKYSQTIFKDEGVFRLGAPTLINAKFTVKQKEKIEELARLGYRVVCLAYKPYSEKSSKTKFEVLALIIIEDHIREDAIETISWFRNNGVEIKIISGDDPLTVASIAERVGVENAGSCISLENVALSEIEGLAEKFTVFGRVTPEQKQMLVKALKKKGKVVAMTGDGVNDTLALKEADCSIAMADGSEVARNLSKLVLMDSKFSSLPDVVKEGRQVINNVQQSSVLFIMKTIFTIVLSLFSILTYTNYPFIPRQLFPLELFVIGIPSVILALQPNHKLIKGEFIPEVLKRSVPRAILLLVNVLIVVFLGRFKVLTLEETSSLATLVLSFTGLLNLALLCIPYNTIKTVCVITSATLLSVVIGVMHDFFSITAFNSTSIIVFCTIIISSCIIMYILPKLIKLIKQRIKRQ